MNTNMNTKELIAEMKEVSYQIQILLVKRNAMAMGVDDEFHSMNELNALKKRYAELTRKHKKEWIKSFKATL